MRNKFKPVIKSIMSIFIHLITLNINIFENLLNLISKNKKVDFFFSYHIRPKKTNDILDDKIKVKVNGEKIGIVIQGAILDCGFLCETIKLYKRIFTNDIIIVSTWNDISNSIREEIKNLGVVLIESNKPQSGGFINLNYQIVNTRAGVIKAMELGCKYVLKTRTDIRIYETGVGNFLISLLNKFPSNNIKQNKRIIGIDINTHKYGIGISDIFQFGTIDEMYKMWNVELYNKEVTLDEYKIFEKKSTAIDRFNKKYSECYLLTEYLKKIDKNINSSIKDYYSVLSDNFIIIDDSMINMYWNKYEGDEYKGWKNYKKTLLNSSMKFKDWMTIYENYENLEINEEILKMNYLEWTREKLNYK